MPKRKAKVDHPEQRSPKRGASTQGFYTPFKGLDQHPAHRSRQKSTAPLQNKPVVSEKRPIAESPEDAERLFRMAMADVVPLPDPRSERVPPPSPAMEPARFLAREEMEVYSYLLDLVEGEGEFELTYSDEYVDGAVSGISPQVLKKLRRGDFSYQAHKDLHGLNRKDACDAVVRFVQQSFANNYRCILIVPGRGLNSVDKQPVLKKGLVKWLTRAPLKRLVLAFASARSYDGGAGAFYVLLRRNPGKSTFLSPAR